MKQTEILEGNKLIAKFMDKTFYGRYKINDYGFGTLNEYPPMLYHSSWEWLMPVIEKISKVPIIGATENSDTCYPRTFGMLQDDTGLPMFRFNCCCLYVGATLIEAAWIAVVEFIKSENNLKK
jgi:hypothetical protein